MRRTGMITACAAILTLFLAACGTKKQTSDGLVSMETAKGYEHVVKAEYEEPTTTPGGDNLPGQDGTTGDGSTANIPTPGGDAGQNTGDDNQSEDIVYVAVSKLNLRSAPSLESEIIAQVKYGEAFVRLEKGTDGWDKLLYNGQEVYAYAEYLTAEKIAGSGIAGQLLADAKKK